MSHEHGVGRYEGRDRGVCCVLCGPMSVLRRPGIIHETGRRGRPATNIYCWSDASSVSGLLPADCGQKAGIEGRTRTISPGISARSSGGCSSGEPASPNDGSTRSSRTSASAYGPTLEAIRPAGRSLRGRAPSRASRCGTTFVPTGTGVMPSPSEAQGSGASPSDSSRAGTSRLRTSPLWCVREVSS